MPRIREYTASSSAQVDIPSRRASVSDFNATPDNAGTGLMTGAETVARVVSEREVSDVEAKLAKARAEWTVALQERAASADPGDMGFAKKFNQDFVDYLSETRANIQTPAGQRAFDRGSATLGAHFFERANLYQIQAAGIQAKQDYTTALDASRNTLLRDPTQFQSVLKQMGDALDNREGPYARMPAAVRAELAVQTRKELGLSTAQGIIRMDPELGLKKLKDGDFDVYLDADKKFALERQAEVGIRAKEVEKERAERAREKAEETAREATANKVFAQIVKDPTAVKIDDIINSNLKANQKEHYVGLLQRTLKPGEIKTDPAVMVDLWDRIHLPDSDPRKITREEDVEGFLGRGLTVSDVNALRGEIQGRRTDDGKLESDMRATFLNGAKSQLTGTNQLTGLRDPKGDEQYTRFMAYFLPEYLAQRRAGKSPVALLDPDSPDYLGKALTRFKRSPQEFMRDMITSNPGSVVGAAPGTAIPTAPTPPSGP